jgi:hypothetical protein
MLAVILAFTTLLLGASNPTSLGQVGEVPSLRTQLLEAEFIGLVRPGARELFGASPDHPSARQCERVELEVVEAWRGDAVATLSVSYPANTLRPRAPHLPAGELRLVFLARGQDGLWQVLGQTVANREPATHSDELLASYHAAFQSWSELDALESRDRSRAEYRWLIEQFRQPEMRQLVLPELAGRSIQQRWRAGAFAEQAAQESASFWLSSWPEVSLFSAEGRDLLALLRQSDLDAAAAWLLGQLDAKWQSAKHKDWAQLLANLTSLAGDARYADADRGEAAALRFLDCWFEADAAGLGKADLKPAYRQLRAELLGWLTQAETVHRSPW